MIGAVDSPIAAVIGRLITGVLSAIPTCSITGSIEDMFNSQDRVWMMLSYIGAAGFGVALGPVMSAYITLAFNSWYDQNPMKSAFLLTFDIGNGFSTLLP